MRTIQPSSKRIGRFLEVPNLIELQLNSYKWFLEEGLPELFKTFSPIWDFTQTNYIELVSFTLGEPKYSIQECRDRDMTFEAPIKAIVRFGGKDREVIESEVYLGDLPLMTDKGTFIINGRERVIDELPGIVVANREIDVQGVGAVPPPEAVLPAGAGDDDQAPDRHDVPRRGARARLDRAVDRQGTPDRGRSP